MPPRQIPHDSWAKVYDAAYERSFGSFYSALTLKTLNAVRRYVSPPASIIDFGAGTGRLSLPLSDLGYEVTAVDASSKMLDQLAVKDHQGLIRRVVSPMQDYSDTRRYELALCVFTVIAYVLEEDSLRLSFKRVFGALQPGGIFILDVPTEEVFSGFAYSNDGLLRNVELEAISDGIYRYSEHLEINQASYNDEFKIRCWKLETVMGILFETGFALIEDLSEDFAAAGARYFILMKPE